MGLVFYFVRLIHKQFINFNLQIFLLIYLFIYLNPVKGNTDTCSHRFTKHCEFYSIFSLKSRHFGLVVLSNHGFIYLFFGYFHHSIYFSLVSPFYDGYHWDFLFSFKLLDIFDEITSSQRFKKFLRIFIAVHTDLVETQMCVVTPAYFSLQV